MTLYLIRHAHAGSKNKWSGPDDQRPLSAKGRAQAERIAEQYADVGIKRLLSSPSVRCRQTLEPLAERLGLPIEDHEAMAEDSPPGPGLDLLHRLASEDDDAALCSHGDVIPALVGALEAEGLSGDGHIASAKAGSFILDTEGGRISHTTYVPPPDVDSVKG